MKHLRFSIFCATCAGLVLTGCASETPPEPPVPPPTEAVPPPAPVEAAEVAGEPGGIKVTVALDGKAPDMKPLNRKADPFCAKTQKTDPTVMAKDGKLQNVVVRISSKVKSDAAAAAPAPLMITQNECMYEPRVMTATVGQSIQIANGDKTLHNVHAYKGENKDNWFNAAQPPNAPAIEKPLEDGSIVQLKCDVHPWMAAFVAVSDNPFHGVSGADGVVTLANVPSKAKAYTIETWHEVYGKQQAEVMVEAGKTAEVTVTYKADQAAN